MPEQVPSVGRVVHFVYGDKHVPAIIIDPEVPIIDAAIDERPVQQGLVVFTMERTPFTTVAEYHAGGATATWHWPEFVPSK